MYIEIAKAIIKVVLLAYLFTRFEPIQDRIQSIKDRIYDRQFKGVLVNFVSLLAKLLSCSKCLSFWLAMFMTGSIYISTICMIIMKIYELKLSNWEHKIKLK